MEGAFAYMVAIIFFVIAFNFFFLYMRLKRDRTRTRKSGGVAMEEEKAVRLRDREIQRRLDREQEEAAQRVELRNKTLALYDQVRRRAAAAEKEAAQNNKTEPVKNDKDNKDDD